MNATLRVLLDLICIVGVFLLSVAVTGRSGVSFWDICLAKTPYLVTLTAIWFLVATDQRLFLSRRSEAIVALLFSVARAYFAAFLFSVFILALFMRQDLDRTFLFLFGSLILVSLLLFRLTLGVSLWNLRRRGFNSRRILIIGSNGRTQRLVDILQANEQYGYHVEGFLETDAARRPMLEKRGVPFLGDVDELDKILINRVIDAVYIALPVRSYYEKIQSAAHLCEGVGVPVRFVADLFPLRMASSELSRLGNIPLLSLSPESDSRPQFALHRAVDMGVSLLLMVVLSPVILAVAVAVKLGSPGPVLVRRPRRGPGGAEMQDIVFRTTNSPSLVAGEESLTWVGRVLRRYGIDELPQLLNVFTGEISLAGPLHGKGQSEKVDSPV